MQSQRIRCRVRISSSQTRSEAKRLAVLVRGLQRVEPFTIQRQPINSAEIRLAEAFLEFRLQPLPVFRPDLINDVLFHKKLNYQIVSLRASL